MFLKGINGCKNSIANLFIHFHGIHSYFFFFSAKLLTISNYCLRDAFAFRVRGECFIRAYLRSSQTQNNLIYCIFILSCYIVFLKKYFFILCSTIYNSQTLLFYIFM